MRMLRIKGCRDSSMWYADKVGQLVGYVSAIPEGYLAREPAGFTNIVLQRDAEVVEVQVLELVTPPPPAPLRVVFEVHLPENFTASVALELRERLWRAVQGYTFSHSAKCTFVPLP